ncbi:MAG TPA: hydantoinase/oxoprolinase family protein [Methylomirabilota bacterium]|nr:hydantoinase/oxoprolinase family protein [Methylomirabilota bacterium]
MGVDIGGTFTDIVLTRPDGTLLVNKTSSTPDDPGRAVVTGLADLLRSAGIDAMAVSEIVHGTTVASNAILQKKGARTGLLTTRGFRDVLEIGRIRTPDLFDLTWDKPVPLVERRRRLEVDERMGADGSPVRPLDAASVLAAVERLRADGAEVIALCFINSYVNPAHEREAERLIHARFPDLPVSVSYRVLPEIKEYERTSTTVVNAYLLPIMRRYLDHLAQGLAGIGIRAPLLVIASNGGVVGARAAGEKPVYAVQSGPSAGVAGAARLGRVADTRNLIAFDMGGTTAKASLVEDGRVSLTSEYEFREGISTPSRFIKAGGYMLKVPAIDVAEVGAGAGSLAWIDEGGLLRVGPESAGAAPGPACYGIGGTRPTVTDANVVLGFLNPAYLAGGELKLDAGRAEAAIGAHVARPLGLTVRDAAHGIREVANANMARAIRSVTIERGRDPRDFTLVAFGGSGPVHAVDLARALEIPRVLVPVAPGVFTAVGMLASDVEHHFVRAHAALLPQLEAAAANRLAEEMAAEARAALREEGYAEGAMRLEFACDLRYAGQASELTVPLPAGRFDADALAALAAAFDAEYRATYGYATGETLELVNVRLVAAGVRPDRLDFRAVRVAPRNGAARPARRPVSFARGGAPVETPVVPREAVAAGLRGPAIVESYDSTVVLPPGATAALDACGNIVITL